MVKSFEKREPKRDKNFINLADGITSNVFLKTDKRLLEGTRIDEIALKEIIVASQVRTKFNDNSIKELAKNIEINGLIQPLVVYYKNGYYTLICGERRYRAMTYLNMQKCTCYVLENKTREELIAIQFSENSSREELNYIDKADGILNYQNVTKASERKITKALGISKSEVHRSLMIARMCSGIKEAAKKYNIEKYVLIEYDGVGESDFKMQLYRKIINGEIVKRSQIKKEIKEYAMGGNQVVKKKTRLPKRPITPKGMTANAFLNVMKKNISHNDLKFDNEFKKNLDILIEKTSELVEN